MNIYNIISDIEQTMFVDTKLKYVVKYHEQQLWVVYILLPNGVQSAKLEFLIDQDPNNPDDTDVAGSILRYGSVHPRMVDIIADSIVERL